MSEAAKSIFDNFKKHGYDGIVKLRDERQLETDLIDYKTIKNNTPPINSSDDKRELSKTLSGFANSGGGVIVWGVDCRMTANDKVDCVKELRPITGLELMLSELNGKSPLVVDPGIAGVLHHAIPSPNTLDIGFCITYVPKVDGPPHQAKSAGHAFYYRSGPSFEPMPQWMLADRFNRRPRPKLVLEYSANVINSHEASVNLFIRNDGMHTAKNVAVSLRGTDTFNTCDFRADAAGFVNRSETNRIVLAGSVVLQPTVALNIGYFIANRSKTPEIIIAHELFADDFSYSGEVVWSPHG